MKHVKTIMASAIVSATIVSATAQADTLGNFVGGALGMRSAQEYVDSVNAHRNNRLGDIELQKQVAEHEDWMAERHRKQQHAEAMLNAPATVGPQSQIEFSNFADAGLLNIRPAPEVRDIPIPSTTPKAEPAKEGEHEQVVVNYLEKPPKLGLEMKRLLEERQFYIDTINRRITNNNAKAAEYYRFAEIARANGDAVAFEQYKGAADALIEQSEAVKVDATLAVRQLDNKILLAHGRQALSDLQLGSTSRAAQVMSAYTGANISIVTRSDGKFDIEVNGQLQDTLTLAELSDRLRKTLQSSIP